MVNKRRSVVVWPAPFVGVLAVIALAFAAYAGVATASSTCNSNKPLCSIYTCPRSSDSSNLDTCCQVTYGDDDDNVFDCDNSCCDGDLIRSVTAIVVGVVVSIVVCFLVIPLCYCFWAGVACFAASRNNGSAHTMTTTTTTAGTAPITATTQMSHQSHQQNYPPQQQQGYPPKQPQQQGYPPQGYPQGYPPQGYPPQQQQSYPPQQQQQSYPPQQAPPPYPG